MQVRYNAMPSCGGRTRRSLGRAAIKFLNICLALAITTLNVYAADATSNNALNNFTDEASALIKSYGLQKAESAVAVALPTYSGYGCPGFYVAQALPGTGFKPGVFGIEFVLTDGAAELYGGINFGAGFSKAINGFAAFNINNTSPYQQYVDIRILSSYTDTVQVTLSKRTNSNEEVISRFATRFTPQLSAPIRVNVKSGFHVLTILPIGPTPTNSDSVFNASVTTGLIGGAGGAFSSGAVVGGLLSANPKTSGFSGICVVEPSHGRVSTFGTPSYGSVGADGFGVTVKEAQTNTLVYDFRSNQAPRAPIAYGCYSASYQGYATDAIGCGLLPSFGNSFFDARFSQETQLQNNFWAGFPATVYAFDECPGVKNALSLPQRVILMGKNITVDTIITTGSDLPIAGILAHEWGHQVQFGFGWMNQNAPTVRGSELEADAFSGYYMGLAKGWAGPQLNTYFQRLFTLGDFQFNDRNHHGTPQERLAAGALGMQLAANSMYYNYRYSYPELHQIFTNAIGVAIFKERSLTHEESLAGIPSDVDLAYISEIAVGIASAENLRMPSVPQYLREALFPYSANR